MQVHPSICCRESAYHYVVNGDQGRKRKKNKAVTGRGRNREQWVKGICVALKEEFDRQHSMNVKLSPSFLAFAAKILTQTADLDASFNQTTLVRRAPIAQLNTMRWVQALMAAHDLVIKRQADNLSVRPDKQLFMERRRRNILGL